MFPRADETAREDHRLEIENLDSDASWESDFPDEEEIFVNSNKNTNSSRSASDSSDPDYNLPSASSAKNKRGRKKRGRTVSADGRRRSTAGSKNLAGTDGSRQLEHQNSANKYLLTINNMIQKSALLLCVKWAGSSIVGVENVEFILASPKFCAQFCLFFQN